MEKQQNESEKIVPSGLIGMMRKLSMIGDLVYNGAHMRYYQKAFINERKNEQLKKEYLGKAKKFEREFDNILEMMWPSATKMQSTQIKNFNDKNHHSKNNYK